MKLLMSLLYMGSSVLSANAVGGSSISEFTGRWEVTTSYPGGTSLAGFDLAADSTHLSGRSGYLVPDFAFPYRYEGELRKDGVHLHILAPNGETMFGELVLMTVAGGLRGKGTLHDLPIVISGRRPVTRPTTAPTTHQFVPQVYYRTFSGANPPALHIFPGDTVQTKTIDAAGFDENGVQRAFAGNPQTGPFYIEGAMVGDTIAVHFTKIRLNRDTAFQFRAALAPGVLPPGYHQEPTEKWSNLWRLDRGQRTAKPDQPSETLKNFTVKLVPMLGTVSVAPYGIRPSMPRNWVFLAATWATTKFRKAPPYTCQYSKRVRC